MADIPKMKIPRYNSGELVTTNTDDRDKTYIENYITNFIIPELDKPIDLSDLYEKIEQTNQNVENLANVIVQVETNVENLANVIVQVETNVENLANDLKTANLRMIRLDDDIQAIHDLDLPLKADKEAFANVLTEFNNHYQLKPDATMFQINKSLEKWVDDKVSAGSGGGLTPEQVQEMINEALKPYATQEQLSLKANLADMLTKFGDVDNELNGRVTVEQMDAQIIIAKMYADQLSKTKQDLLVDSGNKQNIKTINGETILGTGDIITSK